MKSQILFFLVTLSITSLYAQVGINTISPTKDLDVNGELRVRNLPMHTPENSFPVTSDPNGNIGRSSTYFLAEVTAQVATSNVDVVLPSSVTPSGDTIINNIDLGITTSVLIPANKEAIVIITYSVPMGMSDFSTPVGYYGIRFLKDGTEADSGSRKYSVNINSLNNSNMITVTNVYTENFTSDSVDRNIIYTLHGYIEQNDSVIDHNYRFNMWSINPPNFNWGRATITKQVFIK